MSKNYVTQSDSHGAAYQVDYDGKRVTPGNVREKLGRGSFSTITAHLLSWKALDQREELPPVPDSLTSGVSALTSDIWHLARTSAREEHDAELAQSIADTAEARAAAVESGNHADRLAEEVGAARDVILTLEGKVAERDGKINEYVKHVRQLEIDAAKKNAEIETLRRVISELAPSGIENGKPTKPPLKAKAANETHPAA